jgi:hypothetical protein
MKKDMTSPEIKLLTITQHNNLIQLNKKLLKLEIEISQELRRLDQYAKLRIMDESFINDYELFVHIVFLQMVNPLLKP